MKRFLGQVFRFLVGLGIILGVFLVIILIAVLVVAGWEAVTSEGFQQAAGKFLGFGLLALAAGLLLFGSWELGNNVVNEWQRERESKRQTEQWGRDNGYIP